MHTRVTLNEKLKDLRVERHLRLEDLAEQTGLSRSALGSYEQDNYMDISAYALFTLADFYGVSVDYLLGITDNRNYSGQTIDTLHLTDPAVEALQSERINTLLLSELIVHPGFRKVLTDMEIYVDGLAAGRIQDVNAMLDAVRKTILEKYPTADGDVYTETLKQAQVSEERYFMQILSEDLAPVLTDIRKQRKKDATTADSQSSAASQFEEDLKEMRTTKGSPQERLTAVLCKKLGIRYDKLTDEERVTLIRILKKSTLLKSPSAHRKSHRIS